MKLWPFHKNETRESYSESVLALLQDAASGEAQDGHTAAVEAAVGLWAGPLQAPVL